MKQINPYLHFNGNCAEAMTFYKECLGGDLSLMKVGDTPFAANMPDMKEQILHAALTINGKMVLMASDSLGNKITQGNNVTVCIVCESKEEIESLFAKLSEGATINHQLEEAFFGTIGDLTDKFGINWMLEFDKPQE